MRTGDLLGTGTISGPTDDSFGSLLELSWNGTKTLTLADGSARKFMQDGDELVITGTCFSRESGNGLGFGACRGVLLPPSFSSMTPKH